MEFIIRSRKDAQNYIINNLDTIIPVISIHSSSNNKPHFPIHWRQSSLFLKFDDIDNKNTEYTFTNTQARQIINYFFLHSIYHDEFLVHCDMGYSRSPAIAAALLRIIGESDDLIFKRYMPNMLVYSTIINEFENLLDEMIDGTPYMVDQARQFVKDNYKTTYINAECMRDK